jgi:hypothetical protein
MPNPDQGIKLYLKGGTPASTTYVDGKGNTITLDNVNNLLGAAYLPGVEFHASAGQQVLLEVIMRFVTATSFTLKLEEKPYDPQGNAIVASTLRGIVLLDAQDDATGWTGTTYTPGNPISGESELVFTPAALSGPSMILAMTTSTRLTGSLFLSAKANAGSLNTNDYIIVRVKS